MPLAALDAEAEAYIGVLADEWDDAGRRPVVQGGCHQSGKVATAAGTVEVRALWGNRVRAGARFARERVAA